MMSMDFNLKKLPTFSPRPGPVVLIILDGFGIGKKDKGDAIFLAQPQNIYQYMKESQEKRLYVELKAHGPAVGLPSDEDMGNSEVAHNAMGSGQIYNQGAKLVNESIENGRIFTSPSWKEVVDQTAKVNKTIHLIGLLSDGNVHSHIKQLFKILDGIVASGGKRIRIHPLLDGRDVPPDSGLNFIAQLESKLAELRNQFKVDAQIGSGGGRMCVTMDRYESDWNIVKRGWDAHVRGIVAPSDITPQYPGYFKSAKEAIETARKVFPEKLDQFNPPFVIIDDKNQPVGKMVDGDAVINFNYRGDRAVEISKAFVYDDFKAFDRVERPKLKYAGLLMYDNEIQLPPTFLVPPPDIQNVSAQFLCANKIPSYAVAETHKYGHVTYFWNGNRSGYIGGSCELYEEVKSDPNEMIESRPIMKAPEVTQKLINALQTKKFKFLRVNYANGDMVGHTGNLQACITAVKALDDYVKKVVDEIMDQKGIAIITADHGNLEEKLDKKGNIKTAHTLNPVPFIILDSQYNGEYFIDISDIKVPGIANTTATWMNLLGFEAPSMYEKSLIKFLK